MKAYQTSSSLLIAILLVVSVLNLPFNVLAAHQDDTAATLRGNAVVGQEERILGKGGGGGGGNGGGGKNNETPSPTPASTPAPTKASTPRPTQGYPDVPRDSCGTRPPTTSSSPTPPTPPTCVNPGTCSNKDPCCDGFECSGGKEKTCVAVRRNLRVEQEAKSFPFQTSVADARHRKLNTCGSDKCNEFNNALLCDVNGDIPPNAKDTPSIICNYQNLSYKADVDPCESNSLSCCEDGNGGFYSPATCWGGIDEQCCPKGYTKNLYGNGCIPLNCCDGNGDFKNDYCPNC